MRKILLVVLFGPLVGAWSCAEFGGSKEQSASTNATQTQEQLDQVEAISQHIYFRLKAGYDTNTALRNSGRVLLQQGKINARHARTIQTTADIARQALDIATSLYLQDQEAQALKSLLKSEMVHNDIQTSIQGAVNQAAGVR